MLSLAKKSAKCIHVSGITISFQIQRAWSELFNISCDTMSVGIPIKLLHEATPHVVTVEMRMGDVYRGTLTSVEDNMNVQMKRVTLTRRDGKVSHLEHVFIRGSKVRFFILPDILACAPMFKRVEALKEGQPLQARGLGRGRGVGSGAGRAAAARAAGVGAFLFFLFNSLLFVSLRYACYYSFLQY